MSTILISTIKKVGQNLNLLLKQKIFFFFIIVLQKASTHTLQAYEP